MSDPFDFHAAHRAMQDITRRIQAAHAQYEQAVERKARAESDYRRLLAGRVVEHRAAGKGAGEAELLARGDCHQAGYDRDLAAGMERAAWAVLEDLRGQRASVHRLAEWSRTISPLA